MIWNHTDKSKLKMKNLSLEQIKTYLENIKTEILLSYGVYQIEAGGLDLFDEIEGDKNSIMGLPHKINKEILRKYKMKRFFIIGNPISHSLSPTLHNYWFRKYNIEAEYGLLEAKEDEIKNVMNRILKKEVLGINVTLPYKQKVIPFLSEMVNDAKDSNSVNTINLDL